MCTNNIVCHKTKNQVNNIGKKYNNLLNTYISKILIKIWLLLLKLNTMII